MYIDGKLVVAYKSRDIRQITYPGVDNSDNRYYVTAEGDVLDTNPRINLPKKGIFKGKSHVINPYIDKYGYPIVGMLHKKENDNESKRWVFILPRIVAYEFVEHNRDPKLTVNHIDGCKENNDYTNLEWISSDENIKHAYNTGLRYSNIRYTNEEINRLCEILQDYPTVSRYNACIEAGLDITPDKAITLVDHLITRGDRKDITSKYDFSARKNLHSHWRKPKKEIGLDNKIIECHYNGMNAIEIFETVYDKKYNDVRKSTRKYFRERYKRLIPEQEWNIPKTDKSRSGTIFTTEIKNKIIELYNQGLSYEKIYEVIFNDQYYDTTNISLRDMYKKWYNKLISDTSNTISTNQQPYNLYIPNLVENYNNIVQQKQLPDNIVLNNNPDLSPIAYIVLDEALDYRVPIMSFTNISL